MTPDPPVIKLEKHAYGGSALGRLPDGRAAFVPFALPGEEVRLRVVAEHRGHVQAELLEVLTASPDRITPRCPHFGACGGCHYQHLAPAAQLDARMDILRDQFRRLGGMDQPPLRPIVPAPQPWNYRNTIQFHAAPGGEPGFIAADGRSVLPVRECHLPEPALDALWHSLRLDPDLGLERLSLRLGAGGEAMVLIESPLVPALELESGISVVHLQDDSTLVMAGDDHLVMEVNGRAFRLSAGAFFQVNTAMAGRMVDHLLERLPVGAHTTLMDVYCGVGLFSAFFAGRVAHLVGIEVSPHACDDFGVNLDEFDNVELYQGAAEDILPHLAVKPGAVILDPPRAGLDKRLLDALLRLAPEHIAYVSCDPATLARDAARLTTGGYRLVEVTPFDLFPQTYHIESISLFTR